LPFSSSVAGRDRPTFRGLRARAGSDGRPAPRNPDDILDRQIHPLKLAVDVATSFVSTWLMWRHALGPYGQHGFDYVVGGG
jgi:hypothetical protein